MIIIMNTNYRDTYSIYKAINSLFTYQIVFKINGKYI